MDVKKGIYPKSMKSFHHHTNDKKDVSLVEKDVLKQEIFSVLSDLNLPAGKQTNGHWTAEDSERKVEGLFSKFNQSYKKKNKKRIFTGINKESSFEKDNEKKIDFNPKQQSTSLENKNTILENQEFNLNENELKKKKSQEENIEKWYNVQLPPIKTLNHPCLKDLKKTRKFDERAKKLLDNIEKDKIKECSENQWLRQLLKSGTLSDKVTAMALLVVKDPFHNLAQLVSLIKLSERKERRVAQLSISAAADLFINHLLPHNRPLVSFKDRISNLVKLDESEVTDDHLLYWALESEIKTQYIAFLRYLESWSFDNLEYLKRNIISMAFKLLAACPEQEQFLLMLIVNKLGDSDRKIASHVVYVLIELIKKHPNMRTVIVVEVEQFLFQTKTPLSGIYYGTTFLNQIILQKQRDNTLASKLINIYIRLFKKIVCVDGHFIASNFSNKSKANINKPSKKHFSGKHLRNNRRVKYVKAMRKSKDSVVIGTMQTAEILRSRLLSAILVGINRAFPYSNIEGDIFKEQIDALFHMIHIGTFSIATQVFMLLLQIMLSRNAVSDRFYRTLYGKLLSPELLTSTKQTIFLNVLFRAIRHDIDHNRILAFIKRILQISMNSSAAFCAGTLILVSSLLNVHSSLKKVIFGNKDINYHGIDLGKTINNVDSNSKKLEVEKVKEHESLSFLIEEENNQISIPEEKLPRSSIDQKEHESKKIEVDDYDPSKREPKFAGSFSSMYLWELELLTRHYHPTIRKFAMAILTNESIKYDGNPLRDFGLNAFLDRFVYRNPRTRDLENLKKSSKNSVFGLHGRMARIGTKAGATPVNSAKFLLQNSSCVNSDEYFFYEYFHTRANNMGKDLKEELSNALLSGKKSSVGISICDDQEEEEDKYADQLAQNILRDLHGDPDIDDDIDFDLDWSPDIDNGCKKSNETNQKNLLGNDYDNLGRAETYEEYYSTDDDDDDLTFEEDSIDGDSEGGFKQNDEPFQQLTLPKKKKRNQKANDWNTRIARSEFKNKRKKKQMHHS